MNKILKEYNINVTNIEKLSKGYATNKWIVTTDKNKYILKEENIEKERLEYILYVLDSIKEITPNIIKTNKNNKYVKFNNKFYYMMEYIETKNNFEYLDSNTYFEIGNFLAKLHKQLSHLKEKTDSFLDFKDNLKTIEKYLEDAKSLNYTEYIEILNYKLSILNELKNIKINLNKLDFQIIHGDFYIDNILYDNKYKIIDFDQTCNFYKEYEILRAMLMVCLTEDREETLNNMKYFMNGYFNNNKINSPLDAYNLYLYIQANSLSSLKKEHYNIKTKRDFAIKRFKILKFIYNERENIINILSKKYTC